MRKDISNFKIEEDPEGKWIAGYACSYCGTLYKTKKEAEQCWESHEELTFEPLWGGIGSGSDLPIEVIIKRHQRGYVTEIASYERKEIKKVLIKEKEQRK